MSTLRDINIRNYGTLTPEEQTKLLLEIRFRRRQETRKVKEPRAAKVPTQVAMKIPKKVEKVISGMTLEQIQEFLLKKVENG